MSTPDASAPPRPSALLANLPRHPKAPPSAAQNPVRVQASLTKALYIATHDRCQPPSDQIVQSERQNLLLRQFHARAERQIQERQKRASGEGDERSSKKARR